MPISRNWLLFISDVVGLGVLAVLVAIVFHWLAPNDGSRLILSLLAYMILALCSLGMWHSDSASKKFTDPSEWAAMGGISIVIGIVFFAIDMLGGSIFHPGVSPIEAGTKAGSPFGFGLTLICCPGVTMIAAAGFARSFLVPENRADG